MAEEWTLEKLFEEVRYSRQVHQSWADWGRANPEALHSPDPRPMGEHIGDPEFHDSQVAKYDAIERFLCALAEPLPLGGT